MDKNHKVSIVIPTFKRSDLIKRALNSVISQTYNNLEIIVVDDNANYPNVRKKNRKTINHFNDERILYIENMTNLGGALSRNVGVFISKGDYIAFLDDDDIYLPTKIEVQLHEMQLFNWDFSVTDNETYNMDNLKIAERNQKLTNTMKRNDLIRVNLIYHISPTSTFMYKSHFLKSIGGFDDVPTGHEFFLIQKTINAKAKIGYIPKVLSHNYMHDGEQLSTSFKKKDGLNIMIKEKRKYFYLLSRSERNYVLCRHYGVLFFVYYKNKKYLNAILNAFLSFLSSPKQSYIWFTEYKKKIIS